jgi:MFS family permease
MFIYSLDNTITADLGPAIVNEFGEVGMLPWLSVGFNIGVFGALLPMGRLYATFDAKWVYTASVAFFLGASALCGAAPNMNAMVVGRVFLGVGGSGIYCGIMTLLTLLTEEHERPAYFSISGVVWSVGTVLGPVVGGGFERVDWRWAFYINLVIGGMFLPIYAFVIPSFSHMLPQGVSWIRRMNGFDILGSVFLISSSTCLVMGINFGGILYPWDGPSSITLFVVGGVLLVAFCVQQYFSFLTDAEKRIFPGSLLRLKDPVLLFLATVGSNAAAFIPIFYIPVYFQFSRGDSALQAAVRLLPLIIVFSVTNLAQGFTLVRVGYYWPWFVAGGILEVVGNVMLCAFCHKRQVPHR